MAEIDYNTLATKIVADAQKAGAEHSEVCLVYGYQYSIRLEESSVVNASRKSLTGLGLRVLVDKAVGLGSSSDLKASVLSSVVKDAVSLARASTPNPDNVGFPEKPKNYPTVKGLSDKSLLSLGSDELVELAITGLDASLAINSELNVNGMVQLTIATKVVANSNGIDVSSDGSYMQMYLNNKIAKDDDVGVGFDYAFGRTLKEINPTSVGTTAAEKALKMLGGKKITTGDYPFLLDQRAARNTIDGIISRGVSAYNIVQGTAYFNDRLGEEIASDVLTVVDNPHEPGGYGSRFFDDEGTPTQRTVIVDKGVLLSYLSDFYTANKLDIPNTGSAAKQGYAGVPHPDTSLIQIAAGDASKDELFAELGTGLYLENPLFAMGGTNISQQVDVGFWVEKGEIQHPVKNTMLGTTVYDVLKNVKLVGKDLLIEGGMQSPMLLFGPTKFSSGR